VSQHARSPVCSWPACADCRLYGAACLAILLCRTCGVSPAMSPDGSHVRWRTRCAVQVRWAPLCFPLSFSADLLYGQPSISATSSGVVPSGVQDVKIEQRFSSHLRVVRAVARVMRPGGGACNGGWRKWVTVKPDAQQNPGGRKWGALIGCYHKRP
jgi:hypothetical protein